MSKRLIIIFFVKLVVLKPENINLKSKSDKKIKSIILEMHSIFV